MPPVSLTGPINSITVDLAPTDTADVGAAVLSSIPPVQTGIFAAFAEIAAQAVMVAQAVAVGAVASSADISATASASGAAVRIATASAEIAAGASVDAVQVSAQRVERSASIAAVAAVSGAGRDAAQAAEPRSASIAAVASVSGASVTIEARDASIATSAAVSGEAARIATGAASIAATASVSGEAVRIATSDASIAAAAAVSGAGEDLAGSVEADLTTTSTHAQDTIIVMGTGAGEVDQNQDAVIAFTVPAGWSAGANQGGIVANFGGFSGALVVLDDNGRIFAGTTAGADGDLISTSGAVSGGDRIVAQFALGQVVKLWINNSPVHGTALEEASSGTVDASAWSGGDDGGYISRTTGAVTGGQQGIATTLIDLFSWAAHGTLGTEQAPVGTWADLTYYKGQQVAEAASASASITAVASVSGAAVTVVSASASIAASAAVSGVGEAIVGGDFVQDRAGDNILTRAGETISLRAA